MKKHLIKLLAAGMAVIVLAACGGGSSENSSDTYGDPQATPTPAPARPTDPGNGNGEVDGPLYDPWGRPLFDERGWPLTQGITETPMDLNGRVITMFTNQYNWYQYRDVVGETGAETRALRAIMQQIEEDYNFEFHLINAGAGDGTVMETLWAHRQAGDAFDLFNFTVNGISQENLITNDFVIPLSHPAVATIIDFDNQPFHVESALSYMFGYQFGIHILKLNTNNLFRGVTTFNVDMMHDLELPNFYEMFRNRTWTWDNLVSVSRQIVTASNGEITPIVQSNEQSFIPHLIASNGGALAVPTADGGMEFVGHRNDAAMDAMNFAVQLIEEGLLRSNTKDGIEVARELIRGTGMMVMGGYSNLRDITTQRVPAADRFGMVPIPIGPQMDDFITVTHSSAMFYIGYGTRNPQEVAAVLVAMANRFPRTNIVEHELNFGVQDTESAEVIEYLLDRMGIDFSRITGGAREHIIDANSYIITLERTPSQAMETIAEYVQYYFDTITRRFHD